MEAGPASSSSRFPPRLEQADSAALHPPLVLSISPPRQAHLEATRAINDLHDRITTGAQVVHAIDTLCVRLEALIDRAELRLGELREAERRVDEALNARDRSSGWSARDDRPLPAGLRLRRSGG